MSDFFNMIMSPLYYFVSGIMVGWHWVFERLGLPADSGWTWLLTIIGLTITIRAMLIPLFVKQIKSSRNMQLLQPQVKELQKKYGHDRERLAQEQMKLFKETGTNPLSSCMPLLLQMPIFFALFRVIDHAANGDPRGFLTAEQADSIESAQFLGAHIADRFIDGDMSIKIITATMVIIMCATTFLTQRQLMSKNMPPSAMTGQYAQTQKLMLYVLPFVFAIGGVAFPIGVLMYWVTSNLWTMSQQFWVIRNNPAPGTPAAEAKAKRDAAKGKGAAAVATAEASTGTATEEQASTPKRQQPKKQSRRDRKGGGGKK